MTDEVDDAIKWTERELKDARQALWYGQTGRAFASIEEAQKQFEIVKEDYDDE